jgi:hypothetical protein
MDLRERLALAWRLVWFKNNKQERNSTLRHARTQLACELATGPGDPDHLFAQQVTEVLLVVESQHHSRYSKKLLRARVDALLQHLDLDVLFEDAVVRDAIRRSSEQLQAEAAPLWGRADNVGAMHRFITGEGWLEQELSPFEGDRLPLVPEAGTGLRDKAARHREATRTEEAALSARLREKATA